MTYIKVHMIKVLINQPSTNDVEVLLFRMNATLGIRAL